MRHTGVVTAPPEQIVQLDATDRQVVKELRADGRLSVNELASRANVSRATAYQRLARLQETGVIRRFTVDVDHRKMGLPIAALVLVTVVQHAWRGVGERLRRLPGVEWLALSTGSFDYVLLVRAPDVDHLRDVILEGLQSMPEVQSAQTLLLLDEPDGPVLTPMILHTPVGRTTSPPPTSPGTSAWLGSDFGSYEDLWKWSVADLDGFWASMWDFFDVPGTRGRRPCSPTGSMPGARWFPGAEPELRRAGAAVGRRPPGGGVPLGGPARRRPSPTGSCAGGSRRWRPGLRELGVGRGDRVAAYAPNIPETLIAFLATASLGAVWSSCSPDFGVKAVLDRFRQIEPKVLLAVDGYVYRGTVHDRRAEVAELARHLPGLEAVVTVPNLGFR